MTGIAFYFDMKKTIENSINFYLYKKIEIFIYSN
jgi:hypothetical protein